MKESNSLDEVENNDLYEHYSFKAGEGQEPLRVDKFLMNFIETLAKLSWYI